MPRRQRSAYGCIEKIDRDRYRVRWMGDAHDGRGYRRLSRTVHGSRVEASEFLARMQLACSDDRPTPTVGQAYEAWVVPDYERMLAAYEAKRAPGRRGELMKPSTVKQMESCWNAHVAPRWAAVRVDAVRYSDVQEWLDTKTEQTAQRCLTVLRSVLRFCMLNEVIDRNVAEYGYRMPHRAAKRGDGVWTLEDLDERLWPALSGSCAEAAFMLAAFDGCRTGECLAPRLDEVRALEVGGMTLAAVPILRQVDAAGAAGLEGDLKNVWSPRPTVVPEPWSLRLLQIKERGEARGLVWLSDDGLREPIGQVTLRKVFNRCLDDAGIERQQFRALRRSWRTWVSGMGISPEILEKMMGHVGQGTTARHYLKPDEGLIAAEVARAFTERPVALRWDPLDAS